MRDSQRTSLIQGKRAGGGQAKCVASVGSRSGRLGIDMMCGIMMSSLRVSRVSVCPVCLLVPETVNSQPSRNKNQPLRSLTRRGIHPVRRFGHDADAARHDEAERVYRSVGRRVVDLKKSFCECEATSELPHLGTLRRDIDQEKE